MGWRLYCLSCCKPNVYIVWQIYTFCRAFCHPTIHCVYVTAVHSNHRCKPVDLFPRFTVPNKTAIFHHCTSFFSSAILILFLLLFTFSLSLFLPFSSLSFLLNHWLQTQPSSSVKAAMQSAILLVGLLLDCWMMACLSFILLGFAWRCSGSPVAVTVQ